MREDQLQSVSLDCDQCRRRATLSPKLVSSIVRFFLILVVADQSRSFDPSLRILGDFCWLLFGLSAAGFGLLNLR